MATAAGVAAVIGAVAGVGSAVLQHRQGKKQEREQKRQTALANRQERAQRARQLRQRLATSRVQQAEIQQAGFSFGVPGSTSVAQSTGAISSDFGGAVGFSQQQLATSEAIAASRNRQAEIAGEFNPFGAISSLAGGLTNPQANRALADLAGF